MLLPDEEIKQILVDDGNAREADLLPDHSGGRNKYTLQNIDTWLATEQDRRLVLTAINAQFAHCEPLIREDEKERIISLIETEAIGGSIDRERFSEDVLFLPTRVIKALKGGSK